MKRQTMNRQFFKYQAAGNDFVILEDKHHEIAFTAEQIRFICHRNFGIGADGIILLQGCEETQFQVVHFNSDGSRAEMCGNGVRSLTHFARRQWNIPDEGSFMADDGPHRYAIKEGNIWVEILAKPNMEFINEAGKELACLDIGVPHVVLSVDGFHSSEIIQLGEKLNSDERLPRGANVNFVLRREGQFHVRTYERGVYAETLACGTGATATALYAVQHLKASWPVALNFPGGLLTIDQRENGYWLTGPVELVFSGSLLDSTL